MNRPTVDQFIVEFNSMRECAQLLGQSQKELDGYVQDRLQMEQLLLDEGVDSHHDLSEVGAILWRRYYRRWSSRTLEGSMQDYATEFVLLAKECGYMADLKQVLF